MKSHYKIVILALVLLFSGACNDTNQKKVTYISSGAISEYQLQYRNDRQEMVNLKVTPESASDKWKFEFMADQGEIVYISGNYKDIQSSLLIQILVDGKVYKQGNSQADTIKYLTVSGVVPYN
ncbi:MAG: hypothetical protein A2W85_06830 [Bacteroidetes bacterium GWF2_41_31]|nr:MAG: hypothetical protein A2W85_06830 [Bacteroidetes bacterium GWF2_41_31]